MKRKEILPYLNKFISVILLDGSEHSGYISNPSDITNAGEDDDVQVSLLNGFFAESVSLRDICFLSLPQRDETVNIPVVDLKSGYTSAPVLTGEELRLYSGDVDEELANLYHQYLNRFGEHPDVREDLNFDLMSCNQFKAIIRKCLEENEPVDVVMDSFVQAYNQAMHKN
ncbi:MAG: hypothetical protein VZT48_11360 [Bulleidia sp.]|nr:hypothetical protein [Bulleidia sp.]